MILYQKLINFKATRTYLKLIIIDIRKTLNLFFKILKEINSLFLALVYESFILYMVLLCRFLFKQKIINCVEALYQGRYYIVHLLHVRDSDTTKMRMVRYFEHISGMLRQQSKLTKSDGNHGRNKKFEIFRYRKRQHGESRERECFRCTDMLCMKYKN